MEDHVKREDEPPRNSLEDNDRLVGRFTTSGQLHIRVRLCSPTNELSPPLTAAVINISVTGLLVRIASDQKVRPDASVTIGDGTSTAVCRVAHANSPSGSETQQLGLEIVEMTDAFREELHLTIAALRKDRGGLLDAWEHSR